MDYVPRNDPNETSVSITVRDIDVTVRSDEESLHEVQVAAVGTFKDITSGAIRLDDNNTHEHAIEFNYDE